MATMFSTEFDIEDDVSFDVGDFLRCKKSSDEGTVIFKGNTRAVLRFDDGDLRYVDLEDVDFDKRYEVMR